MRRNGSIITVSQSVNEIAMFFPLRHQASESATAPLATWEPTNTTTIAAYRHITSFQIGCQMLGARGTRSCQNFLKFDTVSSRRLISRCFGVMERVHGLSTVVGRHAAEHVHRDALPEMLKRSNSIDGFLQLAKTTVTTLHRIGGRRTAFIVQKMETLLQHRRFQRFEKMKRSLETRSPSS